jgi:CBS domain-containing protein
MTPDPTCCAASDNALRAAEIMKIEDVGAVPVVEDANSRKLVGIVTDRDIVLQAVAEGKDVNNCRVEEIMSRNPVTCRGDEDIAHAMDRMSQHQIRRIPVVDGKDRLVGIISQADIATRVELPERTASVLENISQPVGS